MRHLRVLRHRLRSLLRSHAVDDELERELTLHVEQMIRELREEAGLSEAEARRVARLRFGSPTATREQCRDTRRVGVLEDLVKDTRYGARLLARSPGFTLAAVLSLALGIGANTAIFGLVDAVLLRALPVERPHDLVFLQTAGSEGRGGAPPYPIFQRVRSEASAFSGMAGFATDDLRLEVDGRVEQVFGQVASGSYFGLLGLTPAAGRLMTAEDEAADRPVAVLGYGYWQRRFGGAPDAVGRTIAFRDRAYTIIGVTPARFWGLEPGRQVEVTLPIGLEHDLRASHDTWGWYTVIARLAPGADVQRATAQSNTIFQSAMDDRGTSEAQRRRFARIELTPASHGSGGLRSRFATPLFALAIVSGAVLLIACANLGNLLLVRGAARGRELALRLATGADVGRLVRQLLTETVLLFVLGGMASLAMAALTIRTLAGFVAVGRLPILLDVRYDWRLVAFAGGVALGAGLVTGLWPALRAARTDPQAAMKDVEGRVAGSTRLGAAARVFGTAQIALSLVLVVAAVIFARTMANLRAVDLGFEATRVLTMSIDPRLPGSTPNAPAEWREQFWREVLARVRALPGVRTAGVSVLTPLSGRDRGLRMSVPGYQPRDEREGTIHLNHVSEDYFETFGIQVLRGRAPTARDAAGAVPVAVVNEAAARAYFGGRDPIGETVTLGGTNTYQVVGVVRDHKHRSLREAPPRFVYIPIWQPIDIRDRMTLSVSSTQPVGALSRAVADEVHAIEPRALVSDVLSVGDQIDATLVTERLLSALAVGFAVLALGVAAIGLYGVLSYAVARRTTELGVRMALGASPAEVAWSVFRGVLGQLALGIALGLPLAAIAARAAESLQFGVTTSDPWIYILAAVVVTAVACLAAWMPARHAAWLDPSEALRHR